MSEATTGTVRVNRKFSQSAERVFEAWLDPAKAGKFLFATPKGQMVRAEIDPRVGGKFCFIDRRDGEDVEHSGEYIEIDRPRRLAFDFSVSKVPGAMTRVTIDIRPMEEGCELTLVQDMAPPDYAERTRHGWTTILDGLAATL